MGSRTGPNEYSLLERIDRRKFVATRHAHLLVTDQSVGDASPERPELARFAEAIAKHRRLVELAATRTVSEAVVDQSAAEFSRLVRIGPAAYSAPEPKDSLSAQVASSFPGSPARRGEPRPQFSVGYGG